MDGPVLTSRQTSAILCIHWKILLNIGLSVSEAVCLQEGALRDPH